MLYYIKKIYVLLAVLCLTYTLMADNFVLVIDAGHGGHDPGTLGANSKEKDINLSVALKVGKLIEQSHKDVNVIYTRKTDIYLPVHERADIANRNKANMFISIHANGVDNKSAHGAETFTMGLAKSNDNFEVAKKENSVILLEDDHETKYDGFNPASIESYIMFEFMQDKYNTNSIEFASLIQNNFVKDCKRRDRGVRQGPFLVLHRSACPSVLVELGFISNLEEEKYVTSAKGQEELSKAIATAFDDYKRSYDKKSGVLSAKPTNSVPENNNVKNIEAGKPVFKIQLFAVKEELKSNAPDFKGLKAKETEYYIENGLYKYTTGSTSDYEQILKTQKKIKSKFPDAFIIAFMGNEKISVQEARKILNQK